MDLHEFYKAVDGSYDEVMGRLAKEDRIKKYVKMFESAEDYKEMLAALAEQRYEDAFRSVHNLKGVSLNLGLGCLQSVSSELCEQLRHGAPSCDITAMVDAVSAAYEKVIANIQNLDV